MSYWRYVDLVALELWHIGWCKFSVSSTSHGQCYHQLWSWRDRPSWFVEHVVHAMRHNENQPFGWFALHLPILVTLIFDFLTLEWHSKLHLEQGNMLSLVQYVDYVFHHIMLMWQHSLVVACWRLSTRKRIYYNTHIHFMSQEKVIPFKVFQ